VRGGGRACPSYKESDQHVTNPVDRTSESNEFEYHVVRHISVDTAEEGGKDFSQFRESARTSRIHYHVDELTTLFSLYRHNLVDVGKARTQFRLKIERTKIPECTGL
jgi:hypothetical protein